MVILPECTKLPSVLNAELPPYVQRKLDHAKESAAGARNRCPQEEPASKLKDHSKAVVAVWWSPTHGTRGLELRLLELERFELGYGFCGDERLPRLIRVFQGTNQKYHTNVSHIGYIQIGFRVKRC